MFLYIKNFGYSKIVLITSALALLFLLVLKLVYTIPLKTKINSKIIHQAIINFIGKKEITLKPAWIFFGFIFLVLTNIIALSLPALIQNNNILMSLPSLIERVGSSVLFLFLFLLIQTALGQKFINNKNYLINFAFGLSLFMLLIYTVALAGYLYGYVIFTIIACSLVFSIKEIKKIIINIKKIIFKKNRINLKNSFKFYRFIIILIIFFLMSLLFVSTLKPVPMDGDSLHVYFAAPLAYATEHKFIPLSYSGHSSMGQNIEIIYAGIISLFGTSFVNNLNWLALLLILISTFYLSKQLFNEKTAWLATLFAFLMPMNIYFITTAKVDLWQTFYLLIILILFNNYQKEKKLSVLLLAAWFAGIAIGIKYTSIIFLFSIYLVYLIFSIINHKDYKKIFSHFLLSTLLAIIAFSPWAIKNIYYFDAPFHPLSYLSLENKEKSSEQKMLAEYKKTRSAEVVSFKHGYENNQKNPLDIIKTIWRQSVGHRVMPAMSHNFGWLPFLLIIPILFFKKSKNTKIILSISIISTLLWHLAGNGGVWYVYFVIILLYSLSAKLLTRSPLLAFLSLLIMLIVFSASLPLVSAKDWLYRIKNNEQIISKTIPNYEAIQFFNSLEKNKDNKLLVVGSFRVAYIDKPNKFIDSIDIYFAQVGTLLQASEQSFLDYLDKKNIKYIMFSDLYTAFETWPQFKELTMDEYLKNYNKKIPSLYQDINLFKKFLDNNTRTLYANKGYYIYELK
ncbi:MAG: glycosyltransferase family 39 protein [Patescibacteria group bacterium]|nr:glycosyltransferase family 39 protein [Patescibacteria group bacterium]